LDSEKGKLKNRLAKFRKLKLRFMNADDLIKNQMSKIMHSFEAGLFVGDDNFSIPKDNLDARKMVQETKGA